MGCCSISDFDNFVKMAADGRRTCHLKQGSHTTVKEKKENLAFVLLSGSTQKCNGFYVGSCLAPSQNVMEICSVVL